MEERPHVDQDDIKSNGTNPNEPHERNHLRAIHLDMGEKETQSTNSPELFNPNTLWGFLLDLFPRVSLALLLLPPPLLFLRFRSQSRSLRPAARPRSGAPPLPAAGGAVRGGAPRSTGGQLPRLADRGHPAGNGAVAVAGALPVHPGEAVRRGDEFPLFSGAPVGGGGYHRGRRGILRSCGKECGKMDSEWKAFSFTVAV